MSAIATIAEELNQRAQGRQFGSIQAIRYRLKGVKPPTKWPFTSQSIKDHYAFHLGGRTEMQFNVGFESSNGEERLRHGLAFSLEPSRTLPDIERLVPNIHRFNEFLRIHPNSLSEYVMWHHVGNVRSDNYVASPIRPALIQPHSFIFIGRLAADDQPNYDLILDDFDHLLALYEFVEGQAPFPALTPSNAPFQFKPGCAIKPEAATLSRADSILNVRLRHNHIQRKLHESLVAKYGEGAAGTEISSGIGTRIDLVLRQGEAYHMYEIKTGLSARACIREALGQLLEYSHWPGTQMAERLVVVGEPPLDREAAEYLASIRENFSLPLHYCQYQADTGCFVE